MIVGRGMWDNGIIQTCGILDIEAEREPSDHVPIWVDISLEETREKREQRGVSSRIVFDEANNASTHER